MNSITEEIYPASKQSMLLIAINKALKDNKDILKNKTARVIKKSINGIVKKTDKEKVVSIKKIKETDLKYCQCSPLSFIYFINTS